MNLLKGKYNTGSQTVHHCQMFCNENICGYFSLPFLLRRQL